MDVLTRPPDDSAARAPAAASRELERQLDAAHQGAAPPQGSAAETGQEQTAALSRGSEATAAASSPDPDPCPEDPDPCPEDPDGAPLLCPPRVCPPLVQVKVVMLSGEPLTVACEDISALLDRDGEELAKNSSGLLAAKGAGAGAGVVKGAGRAEDERGEKIGDVVATTTTATTAEPPAARVWHEELRVAILWALGPRKVPGAALSLVVPIADQNGGAADEVVGLNGAPGEKISLRRRTVEIPAEQLEDNDFHFHVAVEGDARHIPQYLSFSEEDSGVLDVQKTCETFWKTCTSYLSRQSWMYYACNGGLDFSQHRAFFLLFQRPPTRDEITISSYRRPGSYYSRVSWAAGLGTLWYDDEAFESFLRSLVVTTDAVWNNERRDGRLDGNRSLSQDVVFEKLMDCPDRDMEAAFWDRAFPLGERLTEVQVQLLSAFVESLGQDAPEWLVQLLRIDRCVRSRNARLARQTAEQAAEKHELETANAALAARVAELEQKLKSRSTNSGRGEAEDAGAGFGGEERIIGDRVAKYERSWRKRRRSDK